MREVDRLKFCYFRGGLHLTRLEALRRSYRGKRALDDVAAERLAIRIESDPNVQRVISRFAGDVASAYQEVAALGAGVLREVVTNPMARDADKVAAITLAAKVAGLTDDRLRVTVEHTIPYTRLVALPGEAPLDVRALPEKTDGVPVVHVHESREGGVVLAESEKDRNVLDLERPTKP